MAGAGCASQTEGWTIVTDKLVEEIARALSGNHGYDFDAIIEAERNAWRADAQAAATLSHKRIAELEELLRSAHNAMGTAVDCIADGQPARLEYAQERLLAEMDSIRTISNLETVAALNTKETDRGE